MDSVTKSAIELSRRREVLPYIDSISPQQRQAEWNSSEQRKLLAEQGRNLVKIIKSRIERWQETLQADEMLVIYCDAGRECIAVTHMEFPNWHLAIVSGTDENGNLTRRIENVEGIKLTCKVMKDPSKSHRTPIGFKLPSEN